MGRYIIIALVAFHFCSCHSPGRDIPAPDSYVQPDPAVNPYSIPSIDTTTVIPYEPVKDTIEKLMADDITQEIIETAFDIIEKAIDEGNYDDAETKFQHFERRMDEEGKSTKKYAKRIERIRVKLAVEEIRISNPIDLPIDVGKGIKSEKSTLSIKNSTSYTLTVYYTGTNVKMVIIPPFQTEVFSIKSGQYTVAASVAAPNVSGCYGEKTYLGGSYSTEYYIQTSRF